MNHTYRLVWNQEAQRYVPAPECAKGKGKSSAKSKTKALAPAAVILGAVLSLPGWAAPLDAGALPTGGNVVSGTANIGQTGNAMTVNQGSNKAIIDWTRFDIGRDASVTFQQPDSSAIALNRVTSGVSSWIDGKLNANGQVWLINPNGVLFGQGSRVDVGGMVASTLNITNQDFLDGNYTFTRGSATGSIDNWGEISAADGGHVALLAPTVSNDGIIRARLGTVAMAAGDQITLQAGANGLLNVAVDPATIQTLVQNRQLIVADGGQVIMTGKAADALSASVVSNTGLIQAIRLQEKDGKILLLADMQHGETKAAGTLAAKSVETSAAAFSIDKDLWVNTYGGTWTLTSGLDQRIGSAQAQAIETALGTGDVTVSTASAGSDAGDIHVNADISYSNNKLTLNADNDINVNAQINVNGSGTLTLNHGSSANVNVKGEVNFEKAGTGLLAINGNNYTVIQDVTALQGMMPYDKHFALGGHIDASATAGWNGGAGFNPLTLTNGVFDGLGHTISNLTINRPSERLLGLFGMTLNSTLRNVGLLGGSVVGGASVGAAGIGALVGLNNGDNGGTARITNAYAAGTQVTGDMVVGGLVGSNSASNGGTASIANAYATGQVSGSSYTGGLVGSNSASNGGTASIANAYATGGVIANGYAGGLVGGNIVFDSSSTVTISNVYASGQVQAGTNRVGGLVGVQGGTATINNAVWDSTSTGQSSGVGENNIGTATNIANVNDTNRYQHASYGNFGTWAETAANSGVWQATDATGTQWIMIEGQTRPFLASEYSTTIRNAHQLQLMAYDLGASYRLTNDIDASATDGSNASGMWSSKGFSPVGVSLTSVGDDRHLLFTGVFDGQGHTISDLTINRSGQHWVGLFGWSTGTLRNVGLVGGSIVGRIGTGALAGLSSGVITNAYATSSVRGDSQVGGLVGRTIDGGSITHAYATGAVHASNGGVGGLVGHSNGHIAYTYASGAVTSDTNYNVGALVGYSSGITASFWNTDTNPGMPGVGVSYGISSLTGKTTAELRQLKTFADAGWDIDDAGGTGKVWRIYDGHSGPLLRSLLKQVTVTADVGSITGKTYDGQIASGGASYTTNVTGAVLDGSLRYATNSKNAGDYSTADGTLTIDGLYSTGQQGYDISYTDAPLTIAKKALTVGGTTVAGRTYDGSRDVLGQIRQGSLIENGVVDQDEVTLNVTSATLDSKNAGTRTATVVYGLGGSDAGNYTVADSTHNNITIDKAALNVTGTTVAGRTYDGSRDVLDQTTQGSVTALNDDEVTLNVTSATLDSKNAGSRTATVAYGLTGSDADNYTVADSTHSNIAIGKAMLTVNGTTVNGRTYDSSRDVRNQTTQGSLTAGGVVNGDNVTLNVTSATLDSKNAGSRTATVAYGLTGSDADNYTVADTTHSNIAIAKATLTVNGTTVAGRTYDGSRDVRNQTTQGSVTALNDDEVTLNVTSATLDSKNAGSRTATVAYGLTGSDADNYTVADSTHSHITIAKATLTVSGTTVNGRTYDGSRDVLGQTTQGSVTALNDDEVTLNVTSATLDTKNAGSRTATVVYGLTGSDADNYTVADSTHHNITIDKSTLTVNGTTVNGRTYDGSRDVWDQTSQGSLTALNDDEVTLNVTSATLDTKNAGSRTATVVYGLTGSDADNYTVADTTHSVQIAKKALTMGGITAGNKTYNGNTHAAVHVDGVDWLALGMVAGDDLSVSATGVFDTKNAGQGKTVTLTSSYGGNDLGNYAITDQTTTTADIDKAQITVSTDAVRKTYDGSTRVVGGAAVVTGGTLFGNDSVSGGSFAYADKNAGAGNKTVSVSGVTVNDGNSGGNYAVTYADNTTSTIDRAVLQITASSTTKPVGTALELNGSTGFTASGLVQGETVNRVTLESAGTASDALVGNYAIEASQAVGSGGFEAGNYDIRYVDGSLTVISPMTGGVIWREARAQALPAHWRQSEDSAQLASSGVPHLTLAPGFIHLDEDPQ